MAEQLELTTPVVETKTTRSYQVVYLQLDWDQQRIIIRVKDNLGIQKEIVYEGPTAVTYMRTLNTGNFSSNSMHKRILQRLNQDGVLLGTVTGAPDAAQLMIQGRQ